METIITTSLSPTQKQEISLLVTHCCAYDQILLTYPTEDGGDGCLHALLYEDDQPIGALAGLLLEENTVECVAFVHPLHRRKGYFTLLLSVLTEYFEDCDILFGVRENCDDTMAAIQALEAEFFSKELQMEISLKKCPPLLSTHQLHLQKALSSDPATYMFTLQEQGITIGHCHMTQVSSTCLCLHDVEIEDGMRGQGYGCSFLSLLINHYKNTAYETIMLQVTASNTAALSLYKKTEFHVTETLSYYLY